MSAMSSGCYSRCLITTFGDITLKTPKLNEIPFKTSIIERRRREGSVEEALVEAHLAGVSVRGAEDIFRKVDTMALGNPRPGENQNRGGRNCSKKPKEAVKKVEDCIEEILTCCDFPSEH